MPEINNANDLTGLQKAAIVMLSLPEKQVTEIMCKLDPEEVKRIARAMSHLGAVNQDVVDNMLIEFANTCEGEAGFMGSQETVERLILNTLPKDEFGEVIEDVLKSMGYSLWDKLGKVNVHLVCDYLKGEHPQVAAVIISKLKSDHAAKVLETLPEDLSMELVERMLHMGKVSPEVIAEIEENVTQEFLRGRRRKSTYTNHESVAKIFNDFEQSKGKHFLKKVEDVDPEISAKLRALMFVFDDLINLTDSSIQHIIREADKNKLVFVLKGSDETLKKLFLSNMSTRAAKFMEEEINVLENVRRSEIEQAKDYIMQVAKKLREEGLIFFRDPDDRDD